jgi:peroxiredoxin/predicted 2-oxoglutarate/Fe(II)-dependent dioxygenase YbiX
MAAMATTLLTPGDPAPWFKAATRHNPTYDFSSVAGRTIVLCLFGSAGRPETRAVLEGFGALRDLFDDDRCAFFGVSVDPADADLPCCQDSLPGVRFFLDHDRRVSRLYGACDEGNRYRPHTLVLDERLRVLAVLPFMEGEDHAGKVRTVIERLAAMPRPAPPHAPILIVPHVLEPAVCRTLIEYYDRQGSEESGFMRERDGKTVAMQDPSFKRRRDCTIDDENLRAALRGRVVRRLVPEIAKAFNFQATRMERYIVACYDAEPGGFFRPHRDNTTAGTAHRRFAVTINLNAEDYEGGDLCFPEYGPTTYRAPTGGAVVFGCSLLHEARPVTRGRRFAFLPFLYDDAAARQREANNPHLGDDVTPYRAGLDEPGR